VRRVALLAGAFVAVLGCAAPQRASGPNAPNEKSAVYVPSPAVTSPAATAEAPEPEEPLAGVEPGPPLIRVEASDVPEQAKTLSEFVPPGWKLAQEVRGDLDATGAPDAALVLVRLPLAEGAEPLPDDDLYRDRVLLVVLASPTGDYRRVGFSNEILACTQCGGAFWATLEMPVELDIENREIRITQEYGSRVVTTIEIHLRYAADAARVVLARRIDQDRDRLTGHVTTVDVDYERGVRARVEQVANATKKNMEMFPRANVYLETLKLSDTP
jgi:hypothetical protein